jgi:hypothetical protein
MQTSTRAMARFDNYGCTLGGPWAKRGNARSFLKTDKRTIFVEMSLGGKFQAKSNGWDENRTFPKAMFLKLQYARAAGW